MSGRRYARRKTDTMEQDTLTSRVSTLETQLSNLGDVVHDFISSSTENFRQLREQMSRGQNDTQEKLGQLAITVSKISVPRGADPNTLIQLGLLILAVGSIIFATLGQRITSIESVNENQTALFAAHEKLPLHPVGQARIDALEKRIDKQERDTTSAIEHLDLKLQKEYELMNATVDSRIRELDDRVQREFQSALDNTDKRAQTIQQTSDLIRERNEARLTKLENWIIVREHDDNAELRIRRMKGSVPNGE